MKNPYTIVFGIEPTEYVDRLKQMESIVSDLEEGNQRVFMLTGVRGSGKTVFMTAIKNRFKDKKNWDTVELSTETDMLTGLVDKLSYKDKLSDLFKKASINLSVFGLDVGINSGEAIRNVEVALSRMLETMKKHNRKLLVMVDEVIDNKTVREFASVFQILIRDELPINLVMTGLYENIDNLQNEKNLTFLHRAPKYRLSPLSIGTMAASYQKNLKMDQETSIKFAQITRGYSYAFQVLGYCMWENGGDREKSMIQLKQYLEEYVYDKIWSELSEKDKSVVYAISQVESGRVKEIREKLGMESNEFSPYKKRLIRKGIIGEEDSYARFTLPLFGEFVKENYFAPSTHT